MTDELPTGWAWSTIGEVCSHPQYGWTTSAARSGELRLLRTTDITSGDIDWKTVPFCAEAPRDPEQYVLADGDIVVSRAGSVGKSYLVRKPERAAFASYLIRFRPTIDTEYVAYFLKSGAYWKQISEQTAGIAIPNINGSKLREVALPIAPLPEQQRIVSKIDELFSRIEEGERALERVQKLVERYRQSVLKAAVTGELTREWREKNKDKLGTSIETGAALLARILKARREAWEKAELDKMRAKGITPANDKWRQKYEEPSPPETTDLLELPHGWSWASVDQLSLNQDGKRVPLKASDRDKRPGLYPYYGAQGIIDDIDGFLFDGDYLLVAEDGENLRSRIKPLAFNASGKFWVNNHAHILSMVPGVHRDFLRAAINSLNISQSVTGTAQPKLTQAALSRLAVPITSEPEQSVIASLLDAAESNATAAIEPVTHEIRRASGLRQSILKSAFSGILVNSDPADEPAAALLKRIITENGATATKPKRGRKKSSA